MVTHPWEAPTCPIRRTLLTWSKCHYVCLAIVPRALQTLWQESSHWVAFLLFILNFTWGRLFWGFPGQPWTRDAPASASLIAGTLILLATILLYFLTWHLSIPKMWRVLLVYWFLYHSTIPTREDFLLSCLLCCSQYLAYSHCLIFGG